MSGIDAVIAASRRPGGFAERKTFSLARSRAIEKMRKFALANPHLYILELVQAAVASGAVSIDVSVVGDDVTVGWVGTGHVAPDELGQLFDFLFASKDRLDLAHVRALAVGINAAMVFEPDRVVIESGDAKGGASRLEIRDAGSKVDVGRSDRRFSGTYVRLEGLAGVDSKWHGRGGAMEFGILEARCMELPVPIVFNAEAMFGFASHRVPKLFGYEHTLSFDEGDLYGTIGTPRRNEQAVFKLLTFGVWIQSYPITILADRAVGGIVNFDRLHKTVDHSGFVRDERFEEMRLRLVPHAHDLVRGRRVATGVVRAAGGEELDIFGLRARLEGKKRVVLLREGVQRGAASMARGRTIAEQLQAEVLFAPAELMAGIRAVAGLSCEVVTPDVGDDRDAVFYARRPDGPPPGPYFLAPEPLSPLPVDELVASLVEGEAERTRMLSRLAGASQVQATLYAPRGDGPWAEGLLVRAFTSGRVLAATTVATTYPGYVLDIDLGSAAPASLRRSTHDDAGDAVGSLVEDVARHMADVAMPRLGERSARMLAAVGVGDIHPHRPEAHLVLAAVARAAIVQLRPHRDGDRRPSVGLALPRAPEHFDPLGVALVQTLAGERLGLRQVAELIDRCGGLLFAARRDIAPDLDGLDSTRVLDVDAATEQALVTIFGPSAYVRVDAREELARVDGLVVRDFAAGVRVRSTAHALGVLDVEGAGDAVEGEAAKALMAALIEVADPGGHERVGLGQAAQGEVHHGATHEGARELCRQARIHLRWHAVRAVTLGLPVAPRLFELILGHDLDGRPFRVRDLIALRTTGQRLDLLYGGGEIEGWAQEGAETIDLDGAPDEGITLVVNPLVATGVAAALDDVGYGFGVDFDGRRASSQVDVSTPDAWLFRAEIDEAGISGTVGVSAGPPSADALLVVTASRVPIAPLPSLCRRLGLSGVLRVAVETVEDLDSRLTAMLERVSEEAWPRLVDRLDAFAPGSPAMQLATQRMLAHLDQHLQLVADPSGRIEPRFDRPAAELIASKPLFGLTDRAPVSARRLIDTWSTAVRRGAGEAQALSSLGLVPGGSATAWAHRALVFWRIARPPARPAVTPPEADRLVRGPVGPLTVAHSLQYWLGRLRPDEHASGRWIWILGYGEGLTDALERSVIEINGGRMDISATHPLVTDVLAAQPEDRPVAFGRLVAACYGRLNAVFHEITNEHELVFLRHLGEALRDDVLDLVEPAPEQRRAYRNAEGFGRRALLRW